MEFENGVTTHVRLPGRTTVFQNSVMFSDYRGYSLKQYVILYGEMDTKVHYFARWQRHSTCFVEVRDFDSIYMSYNVITYCCFACAQQMAFHYSNRSCKVLISVAFIVFRYYLNWKYSMALWANGIEIIWYTNVHVRSRNTDIETFCFTCIHVPVLPIQCAVRLKDFKWCW